MRTLKELKEFVKRFTLKRLITKESLEKDLSDFLGFEIVFEEQDYEDSADYSMISTLEMESKLLYFDFYYLIDRLGDLCILEFYYYSENTLNNFDDNQKIIGVSK